MKIRRSITISLLSLTTALLLILINAFGLAQSRELNFEQTPSPRAASVKQQTQQESSINPPSPYDNRWRVVSPSTARASSNPSPSSAATPVGQIPAFDTIILKKNDPTSTAPQPFRLLFYDDGTVANDGDVVRITLNGEVVVNALTLISAGATEVQFDRSPSRPNESIFRPGINLLQVTSLSTGAAPGTTVAVIFPASQVVENTRMEMKRTLLVGETWETRLGFPQISICTVTVKFPCAGTSTSQARPYPESGQHILDAQSIPPAPITAPVVRPPGNPLRSSYPRLLTIDRPGGDARGAASVRPYQCPSGQQRDEYPPKVYRENLGTAHIKCINFSDNTGAGASIRGQNNGYRIVFNGPSYYLEDNTVVEIVVLN